MDEIEKRFEWYLQTLNHYQEKINERTRLRYEMALIFIPTIIGVWGFIGLILTSDFIEKNPMDVPIVAFIGTFGTAFLMYLWRKRTFDLFIEELKNLDIQYYFHNRMVDETDVQLEKISNRHYLIKLKREFPSYYEEVDKKFHLPEPDYSNSVDKELSYKLFDSGLYDMDRASQICIILLIFSLPAILKLYNFSWTAVILGFIFILIPSIILIFKIQKMVNTTKLRKSDIEKYLSS
ncbi:MAG TPA: hypothetical protein PKZ65_01910 [Methanoregulaceae archaeon]|nr:hypothetical protein [Methanoregulaceae archaeon]